jgi:hypothetical protein
LSKLPSLFSKIQSASASPGDLTIRGPIHERSRRTIFPSEIAIPPAVIEGVTGVNGRQAEWLSLMDVGAGDQACNGMNSF